MLVSERRKYPRYACYLPAYIRDIEIQVFLCDLSLNGCFVEVPEKSFLPVGEKIWLNIYLPCVGEISVEGLVMHHGTPTRKGMGIEFIRFPDRLHLVYAKFIKILPILNEAQQLLHKLTKKDKE